MRRCQASPPETTLTPKRCQRARRRKGPSWLRIGGRSPHSWAVIFTEAQCSNLIKTTLALGRILKLGSRTIADPEPPAAPKCQKDGPCTLQLHFRIQAIVLGTWELQAGGFLIAGSYSTQRIQIPYFSGIRAERPCQKSSMIRLKGLCERMVYIPL